jgi:AcrR family transcriptional regulator
MARSPNHNSAVQPALVEAAARLIATEGEAGLTLRRVADEVGTSTMAIYTHFGGMPELRRAVRREGFTRLAQHLAQVRRSDDPVADLAMLGRAYYQNAMSNPHLYRAMSLAWAGDEADPDARTETFDVLVGGVQRCIDSGRFTPSEPSVLATQFWALGHGVISLQLAGLLSADEAIRGVGDGVMNLFVASGDDEKAARRSLTRASRRKS